MLVGLILPDLHWTQWMQGKLFHRTAAEQVYAASLERLHLSHVLQQLHNSISCLFQHCTVTIWKLQYFKSSFLRSILLQTCFFACVNIHNIKLGRTKHIHTKSIWFTVILFLVPLTSFVVCCSWYDWSLKLSVVHSFLHRVPHGNFRLQLSLQSLLSAIGLLEAQINVTFYKFNVQ